MNGEQVRAARILVGWTTAELAEAAGVSVPTMQRIDSARGQVPGRHDTVAKVQAALEARGVQFLEAGTTSEGPGVAMRGRANGRAP